VVPGTAEEYIATYVPRRVPSWVWSAIDADVHTAVNRAADTLPMAKKACSHVAAFAAWVHSEGMSTHPLVLADPDVLERYIQVGMPAARDSTRAARRAVLRTVASRLATAGTEPPQKIAYRRTRPPYTASQVRHYLRLAEAQPTDGRRRSLTAVLALGLGCGLDGRDLAWVRDSDVDLRPSGAVHVTVSGGSRPRTVVALHPYAPMITDCVRRAEQGLLVGGSRCGRHNVTSPALRRMVGDRSLPPLVASRLRASWLVEHLRLGTPLSVLLPAAGLSTARPLEDLLAYVEAPPGDEAARLLQGRV
jgi:hypothetical protein